MTEFYDAIARFYDAENVEMTDDLSMYSALAEIYGGPILDVGVGTGRVMLHLAQEGHQCVGVDTSPQMIARGEQKVTELPSLAANARFVLGDILTYKGDFPFNMILLPYHTFMHFHDQDTQLKVLEQLKKNLAPSGVMVFDLPNAGEAFATQDDRAIAMERMFIEPQSGNLVMQQSLNVLNRVTQRLHITWIYDEMMKDGTLKRTLAPLTLRYVFYSEMLLLLRLTGLECVEVYGDYDQGPFEDGCDRMIIVARLC